MTTINSKKAPLDEDVLRRLAHIAQFRGDITWELLEDHGLFCYFDRLPTREEVLKLLGGGGAERHPRRKVPRGG
jgi:hypothetical protein